jgi:hypothetical protein
MILVYLKTFYKKSHFTNAVLIMKYGIVKFYGQGAAINGTDKIFRLGKRIPLSGYQGCQKSQIS